MRFFKNKWEESYERGDNFAFYPKEETVKFLNRFVRKRIEINKFRDILDFSKPIRGLDLGCGIGRMTILMREFGVDAYGIDISSKAIETAKQLATYFGYNDMTQNFILVNGTKIPFENNFFNVAVSEGVFDSMKFKLAKKLIKELDRVTKDIAFISLISGDNDRHYRKFSGEEIVKSQLEKGTVQSYYNWNKIQDLLAETKFNIEWCHLMKEESILSKFRYGRYHVVLRKNILT